MGKFNFKRFNKLKIEDCCVDLHIHSTWTDGQRPIQTILEKADDLGLVAVALTDHIRRRSTYCRAYAKEIHDIASEYNFQTLIGFEAKAVDFDGRLDISAECRSVSDFVIGSVHSIPCEGGFMAPGSIAQAELERAEYRLSLAIIETGEAHVLGHAGGMSIASHGVFSLELLEQIIEACARSQTAFEINSRYHHGLLGWLVEKLERYEPLVSLGSDAHGIGEVGACGAALAELRTW